MKSIIGFRGVIDMSQVWIKSEYGYQYARMVNGKSKSMVGYLAVPGLFEPGCDKFYFFQELLEEIRKTGKCGITFDFCGNGDSYNSITTVTVSSMIENLKSVLDFYKQQGIQEIIAVGRGIGANILNAVADDDAIKIIHMINPMIIDFDSMELLRSFISKNPEEKLPLSKKVLIELKTILYTGGVDMSNIEEEIVSMTLFRELQNPVIVSLLCTFSEKSRVLITKDMISNYWFNYNEYLSSHDFTSFNDRFNIIRRILTDE